jgi:formylglycine-generating enzyme required for sulfatase activity
MRALVVANAAWACGCSTILGIDPPDVVDAGGGMDATRADARAGDASRADAGDAAHADATGMDATHADRGMTDAAKVDGSDVHAADAKQPDASACTWDTWTCTTGTCTGNACSGVTTAVESCAPTGPGMTDCGKSVESCCTSIEVPGGTYYRTYDIDESEVPSADGGWPDKADPATVSGFLLDKYLVTVGRFRQFQIAWSGGYAPTAGQGKHLHLNDTSGLANSGGPSATYETGWDTSDTLAPTDANLVICGSNSTWTSSADGNEDLPINCITWQEAYAFCIWDGGFLPSEAEWGYAAAGGSEQREYPWGTTNPGTASKYAVFGGSVRPDGGTGTAPVGSAPNGAGRWGHLDLAGDLWEWTLDWSATYVNPCLNCAYLTGSPYRVDRGGSFFEDDASVLLSANRNSVLPDVRYDNVGVRCARSP